MSERLPTCDDLIQWAVDTIRGDSPRLDAELLLAEVTGLGRTSFRAWPEREVAAEHATRFRHLVHKRADGSPIAHLLGQQEFWSLPLKVNPSTLIPRPDTECLVEAALALPVPADARVLDLGTGTGAIALALASERPEWRVSACDSVRGAVALATENAAALSLAVTVYLSDWFASLPEGQFELIVSNPPYIAEQDRHLSLGDVRFEPRSALVSGPDGLDDIRQIITSSPRWLARHGWLLLEHGYDQGEPVRQLMTDAGFLSVTTGQDYGQRDRYTLGRWES